MSLLRCIRAARLWLSAALLCSCAGPSEVSQETSEASQVAAASPIAGASPEPPIFEDVTEASGLDFRHFNGMAGRFYYSEMMGAGGALLDVDGDGDLDLFLVQGAELGGVAAADTLRPPPPHMLPLRDRLYLNEGLVEGLHGRVPQFRDVTDASGLDSRGYGMGAVAADFDGDGHTDLYVLNHGPNELWFGRGNGTFERSADLASRVPHWSVAAVPLDADGDGHLDLFVTGYVDYSVAADKTCTDSLGQRNYCGPLAYPPVRDVLLRNRGGSASRDHLFEDISLLAGLDAAFGRALGATAADFDGDGRLEIFVANDGEENQMWHLESGAKLRYQDVSLLWGVAVNATGHAEASMGVALGDADGDGAEDLFVTHLDRETNTLYLARESSRQGHFGFADRSNESGLGAPSFDRTGFGTLWVDWDLDGDLDLPVANGAVKIIKELALGGDEYPLHQSNQLFRNLSNEGRPARFEEVLVDPFTAASEVSRALLAGDLDNDGDDDLVVTNNAGPARIFLNRAGDAQAWIGANLVDADGRLVHHAVGELTRPDGRRLVRRVAVAMGYAGSQDPRLRFGLGTAADSGEATFEIRVRWPDGEVEGFADLLPGRYHELRRGRGEPGETR